jgi:hypothetical protein
MSWWPVGFVIGGLIGIGLRRHDRRLARQRDGRTDPITASAYDAIVADAPQPATIDAPVIPIREGQQNRTT